jgi:hypothetical protein
MYKTVSKKSDWLKTDNVIDIYSVSSCISEDFSDWIGFWQHNGYWFFDSPKIMQHLAMENHISLEKMALFYYLVYEKQWDEKLLQWLPFNPEKSFTTGVVQPQEVTFQGYDIVCFSGQTCAECSPLSCNGLAAELNVNQHCLLDTFEEAQQYLEEGKFQQCEPGPYRIFAVYTIENP